MRIKKKISVTIDADMVDAIEDAANTLNIAKSQLAEDALRLWFKKKTEEHMAEGYIEMAKEDKESADLAFDAQKDILS